VVSENGFCCAEKVQLQQLDFQNKEEEISAFTRSSAVLCKQQCCLVAGSSPSQTSPNEQGTNLCPNPKELRTLPSNSLNPSSSETWSPHKQ
ncbi:unnamed protein product, partial [Pleuronectes platessa]